MNRDLFLAILALEAYSRGYGQRLSGLVTDGGIGNAVFEKDSSALIENGVRKDIVAGFYAIAYEWNGETIISYRGTDDFTDAHQLAA